MGLLGFESFVAEPPTPHYNQKIPCNEPSHCCGTQVLEDRGLSGLLPGPNTIKVHASKLDPLIMCQLEHYVWGWLLTEIYWENPAFNIVHGVTLYLGVT